MTTDTHIRELVRKFIAGIAPDTGVVRVFAYGSRVRGDCDPDSDLDLLVELRALTPTAKRSVQDRAWEMSQEEGYVISVAVVSQDAFENGPLAASEFARNVRNEGIEIAA